MGERYVITGLELVFDLKQVRWISPNILYACTVKIEVHLLCLETENTPNTFVREFRMGVGYSNRDGSLQKVCYILDTYKIL